MKGRARKERKVQNVPKLFHFTCSQSHREAPMLTDVNQILNVTMHIMTFIIILTGLGMLGSKFGIFHWNGESPFCTTVLPQNFWWCVLCDNGFSRFRQEDEVFSSFPIHSPSFLPLCSIPSLSSEVQKYRICKRGFATQQN